MAEVTLPDGSIVSFPDSMSSDQITGAVKNLGIKQQPYSGTILPFSVDEQGNKSFDSNAGVLGALKRAVTLPEQVVSGEMPVLGPDARTNPELVRRSTEFNMLVNPELRGTQAPYQQRPAVPSTTELKATGSADYNAARASGFEGDPAVLSELAARVQNDLTRQGFGAKVARTTHDILGETANPAALEPGARRVVTIDDILALRDNLANVPGSPLIGYKDATAGGIARRAVDDFLGSLDSSSVMAGAASPQELAGTIRNAQGNWGAAQRSNALTGELDRAVTGVGERAENRAATTNSGANIGNKIRQGIESLLENPQKVSRFSDEELAGLQKLVEGGRIQNGLRTTGNVLGGGRGVAASGLAMGGSALLGGGPEGLAAGAAIPVVGALAKMLENTMAKRGLSRADEAVRMNSPLYRELLGQQPYSLPPLDAESAVIRSLMPGLLGIGQQQGGMLAPPQPRRGLLGPLA